MSERRYPARLGKSGGEALSEPNFLKKENSIFGPRDLQRQIRRIVLYEVHRALGVAFVADSRVLIFDPLEIQDFRPNS